MIAALGAGAGALALPRWPAFAQGAPRIAIVGGGLAGLAALDTLARQGVRATLYEARGACGGRTRSVRGVFAPEFAFDEGAQLVNTDHADMIGYCRRFGIRLVDRQAFGPGAELQIGRGGRLVREAELVRALRGIAAHIADDAERLDRDYEAVARELDAFSVADYLDRHAMPAGDARDALEAGIRTEYGVEPAEASALELIWNLPAVDGAHVSRISQSDERYVVSGGTDQVARALARVHAESIRVNKRLVALDIAGPDVRLGFADGEEARADRVIVALPAPLVREAEISGPLPEPWRAFIAEAALGRNEKLIVGYDRQSWRRRMGFGGAVWGSQPFAAIWDAVSLAPPPAEGPGALCFFLGGDQVRALSDATMAELAERFSDVARRAMPELPAPNGRVRRTRWGEEPLTGGAYVNYRPGQLSRFAGLLTTEGEDGAARASVAGPLIFAGEWLSDAWPGYMNGAAQTGRIAAWAALARQAAAA